MKRWLIAVVVVVIIAVGVGAFFGGKSAGGGTPSPAAALKVLTNLTAAQRQSLLGSGGGLAGVFGGGSRGTGGTGATGAGGFTTGSIVSSDSNSITVKLSTGSTKIVLYSPSTVIEVSKTGSASDLTTGQDVTVTGTANSDGSITATRIQVGTLPRVGAGNGGAPGANGGTPGATGGSTPSTT